jgi:hypothetical protein
MTELNGLQKRERVMKIFPTKTPRAPRRTRPIQARLVIGLVLVVASALGCWALVRSMATTVPVVVANALLVEGQQVHAGDFHTEQVALGVPTGAYISDLADVEGKVITRVLHQGELVPRASVGEASETFETTLVLTLAGDVASSLRPGAIIDVWAAPSTRSSSPGVAGNTEPRLVVERARLAHHEAATSSMSTGSQVEIVLPRSSVPSVLQAVASDDEMTVVASSGGLSS